MAEIHVTGLIELQKFLDTLPAKLEANVMRGALKAGANVIKTQAKANAPVGPPSAENRRLYGGYMGALRDSIRVSTRTLRTQGIVMARVIAGGKNRKTGADVFYAHMIEFTGARPHTITRKGSGFLYLFGIFRKSVQHPGFQAKPFLRPALDRQAQNAVIAAAEYMKKRLATKEGLNTADIEIGVES